MSDSVGGGESSGAAGVGQDAEADHEPPQQMPPLPEGDGLGPRETPEEGASPSAKRPRLREEEPEEAAQEAPPAPGAPLQHEEGCGGGGGEEEEEEAALSGGGEAACRQNGDGGHDAPLDGGEMKPEEEQGRAGPADGPSAGPADGPSEGQNVGLDFSLPPQMLTGSWTDYSHFPENYLKGCKW